MSRKGLVVKHVGTDFLELWVSSLDASNLFDGFYPLRLFKSTSCWSPFRQRNTRLGIPHRQLVRCLLCCFLALILSWQKRRGIAEHFASGFGIYVSSSWWWLSTTASLVKERLRNYGYLHQLLGGEMMWIFACLLLESLYKFDTIASNTLQYSFRLEFFKHQVARRIEQYLTNLFVPPIHDTRLCRYHKECLLHKSPL